MAGGNQYMSKEGYEKARKRLDDLKALRMDIADEIGRARGFGDISENAEYDAAKDKQAMNESRISELEDQLSRAQVMEEEGLPDDMALVGTTVTIEDLSDGEEIEYKLVATLEADPDQGWISIESPVGKALIGHVVDDVVAIEVPVGTLQYKVKAIRR